jgi:hypothetical protein
MGMPTSIVAVVTYVPTYTPGTWPARIAVVWGGYTYEVDNPYQLVPVISDTVICEALPNGRQWVLAGIKGY